MSRLGDSKLEWGTTDETWGLVQTVSREFGVEKREGKNGQGNIVVVEKYNPVKRVTGRYLYRDEGTGPETHVQANTTITITTTGDAIEISRVTDEWSNEQWREVSFEGTLYPNLGS
jgi:hypothetical protein